MSGSQFVKKRKNWWNTVNKTIDMYWIITRLFYGSTTRAFTLTGYMITEVKKLKSIYFNYPQKCYSYWLNIIINFYASEVNIDESGISHLKVVKAKSGERGVYNNAVNASTNYIRF